MRKATAVYKALIRTANAGRGAKADDEVANVAVGRLDDRRARHLVCIIAADQDTDVVSNIFSLPRYSAVEGGIEKCGPSFLEVSTARIR